MRETARPGVGTGPRVGDTVAVTRSRSKPPRAALALIVIAGCAHSAPLAADHPASPSAPIGRLAAPPPSLAPGVVTYRAADTAAPAAAAPHHHHHAEPAAPAPPAEPTEPAEPPHHHHEATPADPAKPAAPPHHHEATPADPAKPATPAHHH